MKDFGRKTYMDESLTFEDLMRATTNKEIADRGYIFKRLEFKKPYDSNCSNQQMLHYFHDPLAFRKFDGTLGFDPTSYPGVIPEMPVTPETPGTPVTPVYINKLWAYGHDRFSCFGLGNDYTQTDGVSVDYQWLALNVSDKFSYSNNSPENDPGFAEIYDTYPFGYEVDYDLFEHYYDEDIGCWIARYVIDEDTLPATISWGGKTYNQDHYDEDLDEWQYKSTTTHAFIEITWPTVNWTQNAIAFQAAWLHSNCQNTFVIDLDKNMWAAGSNHCGCLGTGKQVGYTTVCAQIIPFYYAKTYEQIPGSWKMVTGPKGLANSFVWAIKDNGTLWCAGGYDGGRNLGAKNTIVSTFTQVGSDSDWVAILGTDQPFAIKDVLDGYEFYSYNAGISAMELIVSMDSETWIATFGNVTPEELAKACQGMWSPFDPSGYDYTFIGHDPYLDSGFTKAAGTLWFCQDAETTTEERPGTADWMFTSGTPTYPNQIAMQRVPVS